MKKPLGYELFKGNPNLSEEDIEEILGLLGYSIKDTISCTVDEIYKKEGIDILNIRELKFE